MWKYLECFPVQGQLLNNPWLNIAGFFSKTLRSYCDEVCKCSLDKIQNVMSIVFSRKKITHFGSFRGRNPGTYEWTWQVFHVIQYLSLIKIFCKFAPNQTINKVSIWLQTQMLALKWVVSLEPMISGQFSKGTEK